MQTIEKLWSKLESVELVQVRSVEMEPLYKHCFEFTTPTIVEIGSAHGASSIILAEAAKELDGHLYCIDSYPEDYYGQQNFGKKAKDAFTKNVVKKYPKKTLTFHNCTSRDAHPLLVEQFGGKPFIDVLFIDGDHSRNGVDDDCRLYLPLLKNGGYVAFHDYNNVAFIGVKQAADHWCGDWPKTDDAWDLIIRRKP